MSKLKTAVIGVGYLGKFHADKYAALPNCKLVAVVDANAETAQEIADKHGAKALTDYHELLGKVDAVSIAAPTTHAPPDCARLPRAQLPRVNRETDYGYR